MAVTTNWGGERYIKTLTANGEGFYTNICRYSW